MVCGTASFSFGNERHALLRTAWGGNDYVDLRLVSSHTRVPSDGKLKLALDVKLKPGWVTYWTMPGVSGFPPKIIRHDLKNVHQFDVKWPAPARHELPYSDAIGYGGNVLVPIEVTAVEPQLDIVIDIDWRIAVCEEFCVLHEETFSFTIPAATKDEAPRKTGDFVAIKRAVAKVPLASGSDAALGDAYRVYSASVLNDSQNATLEIVLDRVGPLSDVPDLYISSKEGIRFGTAKWQIKSDGKQIRYRFPVFLPDSQTSLEGCDLTVVLVSPKGAFQTKALVGPGL